MDEEIYCGEFWINNNSDEKINGYIKNGILTLSKSFFPKKIQSSTSGKSITTKNLDYLINGELVSGNLISLIGLSCWDNNLDIREYFFSSITFGNNYENKEDIKFKYFDFSFDGLFEFIGEGLLELTQINNNGGSIYLGIDELNLKIHKTGKAIFEGEINDLKIYLINGYNYKNSNSNIRIKNKNVSLFKGISIENNVRFRVESENNEIRIEQIEKILENIQKLFSIILGKDIKLNDIKITNEYFWSEREKKFLKTKKDSVVRDVNIFFQSGFLAENNLKEDNKNSTKLLFSYQEIEDDFGIILKKWFENIEKFRTIYNLYYTTLQSKSLHLENQFLNLVQAIEGMFWKTGIKVEIKKIEYILDDSLSNTKKEEINKKYKLVSKLELIEKYLGINFEIKTKDIKEEIKDIRNLFSHGGDRKDTNYNELMNIVELLNIILEVFIIRELGLKDELYDQIRNYKINTDLKLSII